MFALSIALAGPAPASLAEAAAYAAHAGQNKSTAAVIEALRVRACDLGAAHVCDAWPTRDRLEMACEAGEPAACTGVAWSLVLVDGRLSAEATDPARGAALFEQACTAGILRACVTHALLEQRGIGLEPAPEASVAVLRSACDRGEPWGCVYLGKAHQVGAGTPVDPGQARVRYTQACEAGLPAGCGSLGLALHLGVGGDKDTAGALAQYQDACTAGYLPACENQGALYQEGLVSLPEGPRAMALRTGCDAGNAAACGHLGDLLRTSDPEAALAAHQTACDAKLARGCRGIGVRRLEEGEFDVALPLIQGACEVGEPEACRVWGDLLAAGKLVPRDREAAFAARETACTNGDAPACLQAATQLRKGKGTLKDPEAAQQRTARACTLGALNACP